MYTVLSLLFVFLVLREIDRGPKTTRGNVRGVPTPAVERSHETTEDYLNGLPAGPTRVR
jgi:hypothetical protein